MKKIVSVLKQNYIMLLGIIIVTIYMYSNSVIGNYNLSFTNIMYNMPPWNSYDIKTSGPQLSDVADVFLPSMYTSIEFGSITNLWKSNIGLGMAEDMRNIMYPLNYVYLLPLNIAIIIKSFLEFLIGFFGVYLLMRQYDKGKIVSAISGITYTFSSALVVWHGWPHSDVAIFAPYAFAFFERFLESKKIKELLALSMVIYIMLIAGMPTYAAYFMYLLGFYMLYRTFHIYKVNKKEMFSIWILFAAAVVVGIIMSLPYTASLLLSVGSNGYTNSRLGQAKAILDFKYIRTILYPYFRRNFSLHINESTIYTGIISIILLFFTGINYRNKKHIKFWSVAGIGVVLLIFTHILDPIYTQMPGINSSIKFRNIVTLNFIISILIGINLGDILENKKEYLKNKKGIMVIAVLLTALYFYLSKGVPRSSVVNTGVILIAGLATLGFIIYFNKKIFIGLLLVLTIIDMGKFAKGYLPWIEKGVPIVPEATASILYIQDNTKLSEKIIGVGNWTLFPNTNVYYGIRDVRSHALINTNKDLQNYFMGISESAYTTPTRIAPLNIDNYNLLSYLGVKYIVSEQLSDITDYTEIIQSKKPIGNIKKDLVIEQEIIVDKDNLNGLEILLATYEKQISTKDTLKIELIDTTNNKRIHQEEVFLSQIKDNSYIKFDFSSIKNSKNKKLILNLSSECQEEDAITAWRATNDIYDGDLYIQGIKQDGDIIIKKTYNSSQFEKVIEFEDGLEVGELKSNSNQAEIIKDVLIYDTDDEILEFMKSNYSSNALLLLSDEFEKLGISLSDIKTNEISESEYIKVVEDKGDVLKIEANIEHPRFIILNEYYDKNWNAYINGKKVEVLKSNYLMRGIYVEEVGSNVIEFKYEPIYMYRLLALSIASGLFLVGVFIFRRRIQQYINQIGCA